MFVVVAVCSGGGCGFDRSLLAEDGPTDARRLRQLYSLLVKLVCGEAPLQWWTSLEKQTQEISLQDFLFPKRRKIPRTDFTVLHSRP